MSFTNLPIPRDDLPKYTELELQTVNPLYKRVLYIAQTMWWLMLTGLCITLLITLPLPHKIWLAIAAASLLTAFLWFLLFTAGKAFSNMGYALRQHDLVFRKGWLFESIHIVPLKKIQHCVVKRGPLERTYGLAALKIFTAGGMGADVTLRGLTQQDAGQLKDWLVQHTMLPKTEPETNADHAAGLD